MGPLLQIEPSFETEPSDLLFPLHIARSVSLAEASERTGLHIDTLRKKCKAGLIPGAFQIGGGGWHLKRKELETWWAGLGEENGVRRRR
jgi:excisionase family DNA binding protein